ncbi:MULTISPECIES: enoyl-CoA hydratase-related protein [Caldimonas]|uniref:enoyl-CoA hydratase/isomerase family protein n=1 Tax=Caldimonas TaxID=196013 RepID=UPI00036163E6|nr:MULTISPECIES: enoyl-CoA hydratase-related protein [Caldimonas]GIX24525.1 MAG: enoyl-CoA hydratase [Caldimonas sp.]
MSGRIGVAPDPQLPGVQVVELVNPGKLNAISVGMWEALREVFVGWPQREPGLRAVVLRGADGVFAAGADIDELPGFRFERDSLQHFHEHIVAPALQALLDCEVPLVAQIEGVCVGGGLEIAACCDIRIAGRSARLGAPIGRLGFPMAPDELAVLSRVLDPGSVAEMLLEGRLLDAATAMQRGFVQRVVDDAEVATEATATARRIAALAPHAARLNKRTMRQIALGRAFDAAWRREHFAYAAHPDHREGVMAFIERREPQFTGSSD